MWTTVLFCLFFGLTIAQQSNLRRLDDDTDVNDLVSQKHEPETELVVEEPVGSGL